MKSQKVEINNLTLKVKLITKKISERVRNPWQQHQMEFYEIRNRSKRSSGQPRGSAQELTQARSSD